MIVKQVEAALDVFELFGRVQQPRTLTELADQLALPKSSTFNIIETLSRRGYLYEVRRRGGYYPTQRLMQLATSILEGDPIAQRLHGELLALADETGETVLLSARDGDSVVYVDVVEAPSPVRYAARAGDRRPVFATSGGKAILSTLSATELATVLAGLSFTRYRPGTLADGAALQRDLEEGRARGWFINRSEFTPDVTGIGCPLVIARRRFGLSVAGPNYRMDGRHQAIADLIAARCTRIAALIDEAERGGAFPVASQPRGTAA